MRWFGKRSRDGDDLPVDDPAAPKLPDAARFAPARGRIYRIVRTIGDSDPGTRKRVYRSGVGVSDLSEAQAEMEAHEQARRALADALASRETARAGYAYHADKRLEPYVESVRGAAGEAARVTVNGYGSLVMNANAAMFVDVDTGDEINEPREPIVPESLSDLVGRRADLGFRAYRTLAGWRYLCTSAEFDPASDEVQMLLSELGSDEKYILLCRIQKSFRARLTPKPWRAKERPLSVGADGVERAKLQRVIDRTWKYATARYITSLGSSVVASQIQPVVDYHDLWTQAQVKKPLA